MLAWLRPCHREPPGAGAIRLLLFRRAHVLKDRIRTRQNSPDQTSPAVAGPPQWRRARPGKARKGRGVQGHGETTGPSGSSLSAPAAC
ncbi:hypothetical protein M2345_000423 [Sphingobium sp. B8D3D]|nr:hypothetical protein [Sphingobium sp. B8D3D]MCW2413643.1 hypothetical protein [Sphingobium sp. B8D3A]